MKRLTLIAIVILICSLGGCSARMKSIIDVPSIPISQAKAKTLGGDAITTSLFIDEFMDTRSQRALANVDGKLIESSGDAIPVVVQALKQTLGNQGFSFSDSAPVIISGELRKWFADASSGMKSKLRAEAAIFIEVLDPANKRIYSAVYEGYSSREGSAMNEVVLRDSLGAAMEQAIAQLSTDKQLLTLLSSY